MEIVLRPVINGEKVSRIQRTAANKWQLLGRSDLQQSYPITSTCALKTHGALSAPQRRPFCAVLLSAWNCTWRTFACAVWDVPFPSWHLALQNRQYLAQDRKTWVWAKSASWNCQLLQIVLGLTLMKGWGRQEGCLVCCYQFPDPTNQDCWTCPSSAKSRKWQKPAGQGYLFSSSFLLWGQRKLGKPATS